MNDSPWSANKLNLPPEKSLLERLRDISGPREDRVGRTIGEAADEIESLRKRLSEAESRSQRLEDQVAYLKSKY